MYIFFCDCDCLNASLIYHKITSSSKNNDASSLMVVEEEEGAMVVWWRAVLLVPMRLCDVLSIDL